MLVQGSGGGSCGREGSPTHSTSSPARFALTINAAVANERAYAAGGYAEEAAGAAPPSEPLAPQRLLPRPRLQIRLEQLPGGHASEMRTGK